MLFTISGQKVSVLRNTLNIENSLGERSTCSFQVKDMGGRLQFVKGQPVQVFDDEQALIFAGFIDSAEESYAAPGVKMHSIACVDNHYLADKRIVARGWENVTAGAIVRDLIDYWLADEGITIGEVQDGPVILEAVANYRPASEVLDSLAEKAGFIWWIDALKRLFFVSRETFTAPWDAEAGAGLKDVRVESANPYYRNRQYVKGGRDLTDPQTEVRKGDGTATAFVVGFPIAKVPTIEVSRNGAPWVEQTVGIKGVDEGKDWYWNKGSNTITQDMNAEPLGPDDRIRVTYQGEYDIVVLTEDGNAIDQLQALENGGTGVVEYVEEDMNINSREAAFQLANAKLRQYAVLGRRLRYRTRRRGLRPGQLQRVNLPGHNLRNSEMLIEGVTVRTEGPLVWYEVSAVEGPGQGSWSRIFRALATRGQAFVERVNIGESKTVVLLHSVSESWGWTETVTQKVYACPIPSANLYPRADLYPC